MVALPDSIETALFGEDLLFDDDLQVTASGDYATIDGQAGIKQAILLRLITAPGEYAPFPEYGVGIRLWVKKRRSQADMDSLRTTIFDQIIKEPRIERIIDVEIERIDKVDNTGIKITLKVIILGREQSFTFPTFSE